MDFLFRLRRGMDAIVQNFIFEKSMEPSFKRGTSFTSKPFTSILLTPPCFSMPTSRPSPRAIWYRRNVPKEFFVRLTGPGGPIRNANAFIRRQWPTRRFQPGFLLDGFPRTIPQAQALDAFLGERGRPLDVVVALTAPDAELVRRLSARWECPVCRRVYNAISAPSRDGRHCDDHPEAALGQREDDTVETVKRRLGVYRTQTAPLADYYRGQGRLHEVGGTGALDEVYGALTAAVGR